jgi:hypothetical protein
LYFYVQLDQTCCTHFEAAVKQANAQQE